MMESVRFEEAPLEALAALIRARDHRADVAVSSLPDGDPVVPMDIVRGLIR